MSHMIKDRDIQSIFCDFRHANRTSLGICSRSSHHMHTLASFLPLNYSLYKPWNVSDNHKNRIW